MSTLFTLILVISIVALILGLIKPSIVIRWGSEDKKKRTNVLKYYGILMAISLILTGVTAPQNESEAVKSSNGTSTKVVSTQSTANVDSKKKDEEATAKKKAEEDAKVKEGEAAKNPVNQKWNTSDQDGIKNGNLQIASKVLTYYDATSLKSISETVDLGLVFKSPFKYYGKVLNYSGEVGLIQDYAPNSDISKSIAAGKACSEIHMVTNENISVVFFLIGDSGSIKEGSKVSFYGLPVGTLENQNALGGIVNELMAIGK